MVVRPPDSLLSVQHVAVQREGELRLEGLHFDLGPSTMCGLVGPRGAGKTATLRCLATLVAPTRGQLVINEHDPQRSLLGARRSIGFVPSMLRLEQRLTLLQYLEFFAGLYSVTPTSAQTCLEAVNLLGKRLERVSVLSPDELQRLHLARVLVHDPPVLLLDEPEMELPTEVTRKFYDLLKELRDLGKAILIARSSLEPLLNVCDSFVVLDRGRQVAAGNLAELSSQVTAPPPGQPRRFLLRHGPTNVSVARLLGELDEVEDVTTLVEGVVSFMSRQPELANPRAVDLLVRGGVPIYSLEPGLGALSALAPTTKGAGG